MLRDFALLGALYPLLGTVANAESVNIGDGRFEIVNAEKIIEGRIVMFAVDLKYESESGTANAKSVVYCTTRKGEYYDAKGFSRSIKINASDKTSSITNYVFFKYCPGAKGMSKKELEIYSKYD